MNIGDAIRQQRKALGLTQAELAEAAGVSHRALVDIETGATRRPQRATLQALTAVLGRLEGDPEATRAGWPAEVSVFLDMMGAYLAALPEAARQAKIREIVSTIAAGR